jgi:hypothetical protein
MGLKDIIITGSKGLGDAAMEKVMAWLDDYKKAMAVMETFGFTVGKFKIETGFPPEVQTSLSGSIENIHPAQLKQMMEEHKGESLLASFMQALIVTRQIWERVDLKLQAVTLKVTLGVPPKIDVEIY